MKVRTRTKLDKYFPRLLMGQKQTLDINTSKTLSLLKLFTLQGTQQNNISMYELLGVCQKENCR